MRKDRLTVGCHLSTTGGYLAMGKAALSIDATTFQFFTRNPRGSSHKTPAPEDVAALVAFMAEQGIERPLAHAPYTFNPCAAEERIRRYTAENMRDDLLLLQQIPGAMYNFHPGCHVGAGWEEGTAKTAEILRTILPYSADVKILLETMAGKGTEIGRSFEELRRMIDLADGHPNLGVCLDTCHVSDAGYPIVADLDGVLAEFDRVIGLDRLCAIHVNDSKNPCGAHKDRHEKLGQGHLGEDFFRRLVCHPQLRHLPFYLETPNDMDGYAAEIRLLRQYSEQ